ncbi:MAG TPA: hypothetical protein PK052_10545 [Anaerohalosphaeraceae bacterium]|nr:hypothetical protein [Phycisphaerae bacterium]HOK95054.1 hypothetical protein [Anaerohalosphaeraceae bacterium]HOL32409.1 hypothetical protein [Anaerohalosphaeraceae bacterium]HOM76529.1 hypothetical protein [Anaerohalosphaeraceae bacterium]HPC63904.1 hypothetical protein [Anaerohalosphaeraceae bacterium]
MMNSGQKNTGSWAADGLDGVQKCRYIGGAGRGFEGHSRRLIYCCFPLPETASARPPYAYTRRSH